MPLSTARTADVVHLAHARDVERRGVRALAHVGIVRPGRLDVDDDVRFGQRRLDRALDRVGCRMSLADRRAVLDADHDVGEVPSRRLPHAQPSQLARAAVRRRSPGAPPPRRPRERGPSGRRRCGASTARPRAGRGRRRRAPRSRPPPGSPPARGADRRAPRPSRRGHCRSARRSTRAPGSIGAGDAPRGRRPGEVDADDHADYENAYQVALTGEATVDEPHDCAPGDEDAGDDEDRALGERREVLGFAVPVLVPGSAGRTATPTAKNVSRAAMRSVPESADAETSARLWVARPVPSLSAMSATAAATDQSAAFRGASTARSVRSA